MSQLSSLSGDSLDLDEESFDLEAYYVDIDSKHDRFCMHERLDQREGMLEISFRSQAKSSRSRKSGSNRLLTDSHGDFDALSSSGDSCILSEDEFTYETVDDSATFLTEELEFEDIDLGSDFESDVRDLDDEVLSMDKPKQNFPMVCGQSKAEIILSCDEILRDFKTDIRDSDDVILSMDTSEQRVPIVCEQSKSDMIPSCDSTPEDFETDERGSDNKPLSMDKQSKSDVIRSCENMLQQISPRLNQLRTKRQASARKLSAIMNEIEESESSEEFGKNLNGLRLLLLSPTREPSKMRKSLGELRSQRRKSQMKLASAIESAHRRTEPSPSHTFYSHQVGLAARSA